MSSTTYDPTVTNDYTISWLPMITPWTAPEECSTLYVSYSSYKGLTAFGDDWEKVNASTTCLPPAYLSYAQQNGEHTVTCLGPFSCPGNWYVALTEVISESITKTSCCPSGYDVVLSTDSRGSDLETYATCLSSFYSTDVDLTYAYRNGFYSWTLTTERGKSVTAAATGDSQAGGNDDMRTVTANTFLHGFNIAAPTASGGSGHGGGLSTGAKAGIGVSVAVGVVALVSLVGFVYFLGRKRGRGNRGSDIGVNGEGVTEEDKSGQREVVHPLELDGGGGGLLGELHARDHAPELGAQRDGTPRGELEGVNYWPPVELDVGTVSRSCRDERVPDDGK